MSFDTSGEFCDDNYKFVYEGRNVEIKGDVLIHHTTYMLKLR